MYNIHLFSFLELEYQVYKILELTDLTLIKLK
jgi:hypothetical protein